MSLLNFFKRKKKPEGPIRKKCEIENLPFMIQEEIKNLKNKSERFLGELRSMTNNFSLEIKQKIPELKLLNLDNRKEEQRLKNIVIDNLKEYIYSLERLVEDLEQIEFNETEKYIGKIQSIFNNFGKSSRTPYDRATILIGKELAEVHRMIDSFAKEFNEKLVLNKDNFERINLIKTIKENLNKFKEEKIIQRQVEDSIIDFEKKLIKIEEEKQQTEKNHEEYKKSKEYKEFIEEQEKIKQENKRNNEDILKLKQSINLKPLAKHFHEDKRKSKIIKDYSENFLGSLKEDENLNIVSLLREANQDTHEEKIRELKQRIAEQKVLSLDKKLKELEEELIRISHKLKYKQEELEHEKVRQQRFEEKEKQILSKIKEEAKKIWSDVEIEE